MSWRGGVRGPCANIVCQWGRCTDMQCFCTDVIDKPVVLVLGNMQRYQNNLDALKAKFERLDSYRGAGLDPAAVRSRVPGAAPGTVNVMGTPVYGRRDRTIKIVFARGDVARAALKLKQRFVDQQTEASLQGIKHTPFEPGCACAHSSVPGGETAFRGIPAADAMRSVHHLELLGEGTVQLCADCHRACVRKTEGELAELRDQHAATVLGPHCHRLLPKPALHALASHLTLQFWVTDSATGERVAKRDIWFGPHTDEPELAKTLKDNRWGWQPNPPRARVCTLDATALGMGAAGGGSHASARRALFLFVLFPLVTLVLGEIGLATLLVALEALYKLVFWRRCGTVMHRCLEAVMPARLAAQNNHTLNASTDWKADWKSALFPQELVTFVTTATASAAELLGQISTTTALHNFTLRYGCSNSLLRLLNDHLVMPLAAPLGLAQRMMGSTKSVGLLYSRLFGVVTRRTVDLDMRCDTWWWCCCLCVGLQYCGAERGVQEWRARHTLGAPGRRREHPGVCDDAGVRRHEPEGAWHHDPEAVGGVAVAGTDRAAAGGRASGQAGCDVGRCAECAGARARGQPRADGELGAEAVSALLREAVRGGVHAAGDATHEGRAQALGGDGGVGGADEDRVRSAP